MYAHRYWAKARQEELLQTAARNRLARPGRAGAGRPRHAVGARARRVAAMRLRQLFS